MQIVDDLGQAERAVIGAPVGDGRRVLQVRLLVVGDPVQVARQEAWAVEQPDPAGCILRAEPVVAHRVSEQVGDPDAGRPGTEHDDLLVDEPPA